MIEIDGPPRAFYTTPDGIQHYTVYGHVSKTAQDCLDAYINWFSELKDHKAIIWRRKPELVEIDDNWKITWQCAVVKETDPTITAQIVHECVPLTIKVKL